MQVIEINKKKFGPPSSQQKLEVQEKIKAMRKENEKMIKGMFEFVDAGGGWIDFSYRILPGEPILTIKIMHGEVVDLPFLLAKHLNNVYKKERSIPVNIDTDKGTIVKKSRTRFTPMDIM